MNFYVAELGSIKRIYDKDVYMVTDSVDKSLKDIQRKLKNENPSHPFASFLMGKWCVFKNKLIPILMT